MNGGCGRTAGGDNGVDEECEFGGSEVDGGGGRGGVMGELVVVFDGGEGAGLAEEAEVVDWDGFWEEGLKS